MEQVMYGALERVAEGRSIYAPKEPGGLMAVLKGLRDRFYTAEEFPFIPREALPPGILARAAAISEEGLETWGLRLRGKELEALMLDLRDAGNAGEIERGCRVLALRSTPRIRKLLAALFQYNYQSLGLNAALKVLAEKAAGQNGSSGASGFVERFGLEEDKIGELCGSIDEWDRNIDKCFEAFHIDEESPFAVEVVCCYLAAPSRERLLANRKWLSRIIGAKSAEELFGLIHNYLSAFDLEELHDGVNLAILNKIGIPYESSDWEPYELELRDKFARWRFLHSLKIHTLSMPKKFTVLSGYSLQVRSNFEMPEENLMVVDFGDIVIADIANKPYSYFYEKEVFEQEMEDWRKSREQQALAEETGEEPPEPYRPSFIRMDRKNRTARDFMIEEVEEPCVKLSYEGIDMLYIREMLDIKMGIEPDMRRKQLAKIKKAAAK